jgi:hypothetical protein
VKCLKTSWASTCADMNHRTAPRVAAPAKSLVADETLVTLNQALAPRASVAGYSTSGPLRWMQ